MCMQKLSKMLVSSSRSAVWDIMARYNISTTVDLMPPDSKTFSFLCQNQQVKVDSKIYHLDRFRSSLKSDYFEKLFTSGDFKQKTDKILEIQPKNSELFPTIVDLIHEKKLLDVLNKDNYIPLLEAMDYLEMEPDLKIVSSFIDDNLTTHSPRDAKLFELYSFIRKNTKFEYLLSSVFKFMSGHLKTVRNHEILPSLTLGHLIGIIKNVQNPDDAKRYEIVQMCAKWLCHDMENRLPHMVILINSIKPGFHAEEESVESKNKLRTRLPKTDIDEEAKQKTMVNCVFSLLAYGGKLNPTILDRETLLRENYDEYHRYYEFESPEESQYEEYEGNNYHKISSKCNSEKVKLKKFLENGDFYDITVRVEEKSYKLHRSVLESNSGYFSSIFQAEYAEAVAKYDGTTSITYPSKDKEYILDKINQSTFDAVINYIYFDDNIKSDYNVIPDVFKTADVLKIDELSTNLEERLKWPRERVSLENKIDLLNFIHGKVKYNDLYSFYLCELMTASWPKIHTMTKFCSISWPVLEITLKSPNLLFDDPNKILDICSTWVIHDIKNRYRLLPEIAKAINPYCVPNEEKYTAENSELNDYSQQLVRDELWEILSSIEYLTSAQLITTNTSETSEDIPVFVATNYDQDIDLLNADLDRITPSEFSDFPVPQVWAWFMSTTMIGDNLFVFFGSEYDCFSFHVYNFKLKKKFTLSSDIKMTKRFLEFPLLHCNNEIYCCSKDGYQMAKYSMQLNRWMLIPQNSQHEKSEEPRVRFASDGKNMYKIGRESKYDRRSDYIIETYDFEKNLWTRAPDLPPIKNIASDPKQMIVINDRDLAVSFYEHIAIFDRDSKTWRHCGIPKELWKDEFFFIPQKDRLLVVVDDKLYHVSLLNHNWEFKKAFKPQWKTVFTSKIIAPIYRMNYS